MYNEMHAAACLNLVAASFLWQRHPRHARRLLETAADLLYWLAY